MSSTPTWFLALQSFGIITSFLIAGGAAWQLAKSTRLSNYLTITQFHREIWSRTLGNSSYSRLRSKDVNLWSVPITNDERQFMTFVLLHITCAYELSKDNKIVSIEGLEDDVADLMQFPLFRRHWEESQRFYNDDFRNFVNKRTSETIYRKVGSPKKMRIVVASAFPELLLPALKQFDDELIFTDDTSETAVEDLIAGRNVDFIIAFGFGKIINTKALGSCKAINLHGGFLPWNRGANPNIWSWLDKTKKGVTIHEIDDGIDTGPILAQTEIKLSSSMTLVETFEQIKSELASLFAESWPQIRKGELVAQPQVGEGSSYLMKDQQPFQDILDAGLNRSMKRNIFLIRKRLEEQT